MPRSARWFLALALVLAPPAQSQTLVSLRGYVHDDALRPLAGAEIVLAGVARSVFANQRGYFVFDSLELRQYALTARLPGYAAARLRVDLAADPSLEVDLKLVRLPQVLDSLVVSTTRRGLYGVVGNAALQPMAGVRVAVLGGGMSQATDSAGRFAFPSLKPGAYVVMAEHPVLTGRPLHVTVPRNGSREVVLFLGVGGEEDVPGMTWVWRDLGTRLAFQPASRRMTRDELARHAGRQLCDIARIRGVVSSDAPRIIVNGVQDLPSWPLCSFSADELALVEWGACVTASQGMASGGSVARRPGAGRATRTGCLMVWTR